MPANQVIDNVAQILAQEEMGLAAQNNQNIDYQGEGLPQEGLVDANNYQYEQNNNTDYQGNNYEYEPNNNQFEPLQHGTQMEECA